MQNEMRKITAKDKIKTKGREVKWTGHGKGSKGRTTGRRRLINESKWSVRDEGTKEGATV